MSPFLILLLAFLLGVLTGFRSLVVPAVAAWASHYHLGWLDLQGSRLAFMGSPTAVLILSIFGIGELIADKLPKTPRRTAPLGLIARFIMGGLVGACLVLAGGGSPWVGAALGSLGGILGAYLGFHLRTGLVQALKVPDFVVAVLEDILTIAAAAFILSRLR